MEGDSGQALAIKDHCNVLVARYDQYPQENPNSYAVGFTITCNANGASVYRDACIPFSVSMGKTDVEVIALAWNAVKDGVTTWLQTVMHQKPVVGRVFEVPE
jgi:hypothetical protein